ncbi:hypothetical protein BU17DRAFT_68009 [Hysterangium stoloniferum]|nr:hypothetical protein BU17DRAFT_68009 [Hysterangium stoloniferum]
MTMGKEEAVKPSVGSTSVGGSPQIEVKPLTVVSVMFQCTYHGRLVYNKPIDDKWDMYYASQTSEEEITAIIQDSKMRYPTMPMTIAIWLAFSLDFCTSSKMWQDDDGITA